MASCMARSWSSPGRSPCPRREAAEIAARVGCEVAAGVTKSTTMLVVGDLEARLPNLEGGKSSKQKKAEKLRAEGQHIDILSETDFVELVRQCSGRETRVTELTLTPGYGLFVGWQDGSNAIVKAPPRPYLARLDGQVAGVPGTRAIRASRPGAGATCTSTTSSTRSPAAMFAQPAATESTGRRREWFAQDAEAWAFEDARKLSRWLALYAAHVTKQHARKKLVPRLPALWAAYLDGERTDAAPLALGLPREPDKEFAGSGWVSWEDWSWEPARKKGEKAEAAGALHEDQRRPGHRPRRRGCGAALVHPRGAEAERAQRGAARGSAAPGRGARGRRRSPAWAGLEADAGRDALSPRSASTSATSPGPSATPPRVRHHLHRRLGGVDQAPEDLAARRVARELAGDRAPVARAVAGGGGHSSRGAYQVAARVGRSASVQLGQVERPRRRREDRNNCLPVTHSRSVRLGDS